MSDSLLIKMMENTDNTRVNKIKKIILTFFFEPKRYNWPNETTVLSCHHLRSATSHHCEEKLRDALDLSKGQNKSLELLFVPLEYF